MRFRILYVAFMFYAFSCDTGAYDSIRSEIIKLKYYKNINRLENKV